MKQIFKTGVELAIQTRQLREGNNERKQTKADEDYLYKRTGEHR